MTDEYDRNQEAESLAEAQAQHDAETDAHADEQETKVREEEFNDGMPTNVPATNLMIPIQTSPEQFEQSLLEQESKRKMIMSYVAKNLVAGVDYGIAYPGSDKKTLLKPGSEKINSLLRLTTRFKVDQETRLSLEGSGVGGVFYLCQLCMGENVVAEGRGAVQFVGDFTYKNGTVKPNSFEKGWDANQAIKMCEKRAQVDATLRVACLSDMFTQDLEDMDMAEVVKVEDHKPMAQAKAKATPKPKPKPTPKPQPQGGGNRFTGKTLGQCEKAGEGMIRATWAIINSHMKRMEYDDRDMVDAFAHWFFSVQSIKQIPYEVFQKFSDTFSLTIYDRQTKQVSDKDPQTVQVAHAEFLENWEQFANWKGIE